MSHSHLQDNLIVRSFAVQLALNKFFPRYLYKFLPFSVLICARHYCSEYFLKCSGTIIALSLVGDFLVFGLPLYSLRSLFWGRLGPLRGWIVKTFETLAFVSTLNGSGISLPGLRYVLLMTLLSTNGYQFLLRVGCYKVRLIQSGISALQRWIHFG